MKKIVKNKKGIWKLRIPIPPTRIEKRKDKKEKHKKHWRDYE